MGIGFEYKIILVLGMGIGFGYKIIWVLGMGIGFGNKIIWVLGLGIGFGYKIILVLGMDLGLGIYTQPKPKPKTRKLMGVNVCVPVIIIIFQSSHACKSLAHLALLHDLVDGRPIDVAHLVELVDADDAPVGEHHGARLQPPLARLLVRGHGRRQAHAARAAARRRDRARRRVQHVAQHLRLGHRGVADEQDVDVASEAGAVRQVLFDAAQQHAEDGLFDVFVTMDGWSQR